MKKPQLPRLTPHAVRHAFARALTADDLDTLLDLHRAGHLSRDRLDDIVAERLGPIEAMRWFRRMGDEGRLPPSE